MLLSAVSALVVAQQSSEVPKRLTNYPVLRAVFKTLPPNFAALSDRLFRPVV